MSSAAEQGSDRSTAIEQGQHQARQRTPVPILSRERCCVLYLVNGLEKRSPWFSTFARGRQALALLTARHGRAILFHD